MMNVEEKIAKWKETEQGKRSLRKAEWRRGINDQLEARGLPRLNQYEAHRKVMEVIEVLLETGE